MSEENKKTTIFLDTVGRTILGELIEQNEEVTTVLNPVILNIVPAEGGRMTVQLYPLFFREFLADKSDDVSFSFKNKNITQTNIQAIDFRLLAQYAQLFNKNNIFVPPGVAPQQTPTAPNQQTNNTVVNLFDE
jgi:hypothetical protein